MIIGSPWADVAGESSAGKTHVVFGGAGVGVSGTLDLLSFGAADGFVIHGVERLDTSGGSISVGGDINGDGEDDIIVGASRGDPGTSLNAGETNIVFGGAGVGASGVFELSSLNGANGLIAEGIWSGGNSGYSVSGAGDFNNDGFDDVVIGARGADVNGNSSGEAYLVYGGADVGVSGVFELLSLDCANGFAMPGVNTDSLAGTSVSFAGDVNDDGFDDIIIGARRFDSEGDGEGACYVIFGFAGNGCPLDNSLADLNGDLVVGSADLSILIGSWGDCGDPQDCPADIDGNGTVGSEDLALLIGLWGP